MQLKHTFTAIFLFLAFSGSLFAVYPLCLYKNERRTNLPAAEPSRLANAAKLKEKETDKAVSNSDINAECAYMSRLSMPNKKERLFKTKVGQASTGI